MLIALTCIIVNVAWPQMGAYAQTLIESAIVIWVTMVGFKMILGTVGIRIPNNLNSIVIGGIFKVIKSLGRTLFQILCWVICNTFHMIPRVFRGSKKTFYQMGANGIVSNILATIVVIAFVTVVI